jgi:hypothetical protein
LSIDAFRSRDVLAGHAIVVEDEATSKTGPAPAAPVFGRRFGVSAGVAPDGALLLHADGGTERITTGTVRRADKHDQRSSATAYP